VEANYQRERRQLAARRKAAFAIAPTGPNQVWTFAEFETTVGGTWRLAGCRDYWFKYELSWHVSPDGEPPGFSEVAAALAPFCAASRRHTLNEATMTATHAAPSAYPASTSDT
jgi:hypothetical protein